jgi:hypothetical protein
MKRVVEKRGGKIIVRTRPEDMTAKVHGLAARLAASEQAMLTPRERDLLLVAIAQQLGISV